MNKSIKKVAALLATVSNGLQLEVSSELPYANLAHPDDAAVEVITDATNQSNYGSISPKSILMEREEETHSVKKGHKVYKIADGSYELQALKTMGPAQFSFEIQNGMLKNLWHKNVCDSTHFKITSCEVSNDNELKDERGEYYLITLSGEGLPRGFRNRQLKVRRDQFWTNKKYENYFKDAFELLQYVRQYRNRGVKQGFKVFKLQDGVYPLIRDLGKDETGAARNIVGDYEYCISVRDGVIEDSEHGCLLIRQAVVTEMEILRGFRPYGKDEKLLIFVDQWKDNQTGNYAIEITAGKSWRNLKPKSKFRSYLGREGVCDTKQMPQLHVYRNSDPQFCSRIFFWYAQIFQKNCCGPHFGF